MAVKAAVQDGESRATSVSTEMPSAEMAAKMTAAMTPTTMTPTTMASATASAERYARDQRGKNNDRNSNA
jgi:hypothetical protein